MADRPVLGVTHTPPDFDVPAGACDCHLHIFGPLDRYPLAADHVYTPMQASVDDFLALQDALHLSRVVIVHPSPYGTDNSCTLDALRRLGNRARGVGLIDARTTDTALQDMHAVGIRGVRVNLETYGHNDPAMAARLLDEAARRVAPLGWHVQTYTNIKVIAALKDAILDLPTPLVIDHFGRVPAAGGVAQPGFDAILDLLQRGKVYVKISAPHRISSLSDYADVDAIARAMIDANPDRILWGTDWPHTGGHRDRNMPEPFRPEDDGRALNRLNRWAASATRLQKILVDNPAKLYGF